MKFRRQHPIGQYIVDFYCATSRLVVEVDGGIHRQQQAEDLERARRLEASGYRVIRFSNDEIERDVEAVLERITQVR